MILAAKVEGSKDARVRLHWDDWQHDIGEPMLPAEARRLASVLHKMADAADLINRPPVKAFWK